MTGSVRVEKPISSRRLGSFGRVRTLQKSMYGFRMLGRTAAAPTSRCVIPESAGDAGLRGRARGLSSPARRRQTLATGRRAAGGRARPRRLFSRARSAVIASTAQKNSDIARMALSRMLAAICCALAAAREATADAPWQPARQAGEPMTIHVDYDGAPYHIALRATRGRAAHFRSSSSIRAVRRNLSVGRAVRGLGGSAAAG